MKLRFIARVNNTSFNYLREERIVFHAVYNGLLDDYLDQSEQLGTLTITQIARVNIILAIISLNKRVINELFCIALGIMLDFLAVDKISSNLCNVIDIFYFKNHILILH